jgi:hypothetical protein
MRPARPVFSPFSAFLVRADKRFDGAVVGPLNIVGEKARGKLTHAPVVLDTFAAHAFAAAGIVGTVAPGRVSFNVAFFHDNASVKMNCSDKIYNREDLYGRITSCGRRPHDPCAPALKAQEAQQVICRRRLNTS